MISELGFFSSQAREDEKRIRADHAELFELAENVSREFLRLLEKAELDPNSDKNLRINALAIRSLELFQSTFNLLGQGAVPGAKVICRGLIESVFKLSALQTSNEGMDMYLAQDHASRLKKLQGFQRYNAQKKLPPSAKIENEIDELKKKKIQSPAVSRWAEVAGMTDFYNVYYAVLNDDTHSSVEVLQHYVDDDSNALLNFGPSAKGLSVAGAICLRAILVGLDKYAVYQGAPIDLSHYCRENDRLEKNFFERQSTP